MYDTMILRYEYRTVKENILYIVRKSPEEVSKVVERTPHSSTRQLGCFSYEFVIYDR